MPMPERATARDWLIILAWVFVPIIGACLLGLLTLGCATADQQDFVLLEERLEIIAGEVTELRVEINDPWPMVVVVTGLAAIFTIAGVWRLWLFIRKRRNCGTDNHRNP